MDRLNVMYIFTDQQYAGAMSCAGNEDLHTPAMDRLASEGTRFERAYCTYPLCSPSRASMFAGKHPHELGVTSNGLPIAEAYRPAELGHLLSAAGYECVYGGKWHVPEIAIPETHGFRRICGFDDPGLPRACEAFLEADHDRPFFLVAGFDNPHNICEWRRQQNLPWGEIGAPPRVEDCPTLPANFAIPPFEPEAVRFATHADPYIYPGARYSDEQWRRYRWAYFRLVEKVDAQVGLILNALDAAGLAKNTVVLFSSDHGDHHGANHLVQKSFLYEESIRVPMIVRHPQRAGGNVDGEHLVSNGLDVYATVCDLAGVGVPEHTEGRSLIPLMSPGSDHAWRPNVAVETKTGGRRSDGRAIITGRYKYVAYAWGAHREALFDLEHDPGEMVNLAVASRHAAALQQHRDLLREWCARTGDTFYGGHYSHPDTPFIVPGDAYPQSG